MNRNKLIGAAVLALAGGMSSLEARADSYVLANVASRADQGAYNGILVGYKSPTGITVDSREGKTTYTTSSAALGLNAISLTSSATADSGATAVSKASASLVDGKLRAYAASSGGFTGAFEGGGLLDISTAQIHDVLRFHVDGGGSAKLTLLAHLDGKIGGVPTGFTSASVDDVLVFGSHQFEFLSTSSFFGYSSPTGAPPSGWDSYSTSKVSRTGGDFLGTFTVNDGDTLPFFRSLKLDCRGIVSCDFLNTASLSLKLVPGVRFTSDSGVFLTAPTGGVPEPASWALMIGGFGLAGASLRRRRGAARA